MVSLTPARIKEVTQCDGLLLYIRSYLTVMGLYYYDTPRLWRHVDGVLKGVSFRIHFHVLVDNALKLIRIWIKLFSLGMSK